MGEMTDEELVSKIQEGDVTFFEDLVRRYQKRLYPFVKRIVFDPNIAEEIVSDAFFNVYKTIERVDTARKFSSYIFTIAKNCAFSRLRKKHKNVPLDEEITISEDESFYEAMVRKDEENALKSAIDNLPEKFKLVIRLYYFDELSYEEIGERLKLPLNTVRTHLRRAKAELRKNLDL